MNYKISFLSLLILPILMVSCKEEVVDPSYELSDNKVKENYDKDVVINEYEGDLFDENSLSMGLLNDPNIIKISLTSSLEEDIYNDTYLVVDIDNGSFTYSYESNNLISATYGRKNNFDFSIYYKVKEDYKIEDTNISLKLYDKKLDTYLGCFIYDLSNGTEKASYSIKEIKEAIFPYKNNEPQLVSASFVDSMIKDILNGKEGKEL